MKLSIRTAVVLGALAAMPATAHAADAYWNQQCTNGGWAFNTCASAHVTVTGNTVTIRIWNLAGIPGSNTFGNTGFTAIGLSSLGSGLTFKNLIAKYPDGTQYSGWAFAQGGGGIPGPVGSQGLSIKGTARAIYSQYAANIPGHDDPAVTNWGGSGQFGTGAAVFTFQTFTTSCTGKEAKRVCVDVPTTINLTNAVLGVHAQNGPGGESSGYGCQATAPAFRAELPYPCVSAPPPPPSIVTPEPVTMALLATGLVSMAGVGFYRRRRELSGRSPTR